MTGKLALSKAGHDKDKLYLIVKEEQDTVYLADGRKRGLLNPKKSWNAPFKILPGPTLKSERG